MADGTYSDDDFPDGFRVDVVPGFRGLAMHKTWVARLCEQRNGRWKLVGTSVYNDDGPVPAISDLLSALDMGSLPR